MKKIAIGGTPALRPAAALDRLDTESAFGVLARAAGLQAQGRDIINLGIGQPDFPTPPHIVDAAVRALRDGHHGYTPSAGLPALREAVAADLNRRHAAGVTAGQVFIVPGGKVTIFFACLAFGEPGAEILYPDPGFPTYRSAAAFTGATPVPYPLDDSRDFAIDPDTVLDRITAATRLLILNSPGNPTGGVTDRASLDRLAAGLEAHPRVAVLSDEIYSRMIYTGAPHASMLAYPALRDRLILLDGWSKTYAMTGWRLGYGVWPPALAEAVDRLCINCHSCVNAAAQHAALAALTGPQQPVDRMVAAFARRRVLMRDRLNRIPGLHCPEPAGAFYCLPSVAGTGLSDRALQDGLLDHAGVATLAGSSFGANGAGFIRLSYANSDDNLARALDRIEAWLAGTVANRPGAR